MSTIRTNRSGCRALGGRVLFQANDIFLNPRGTCHNRIIRGVSGRQSPVRRQYKKGMPKPILLAIDDDTSVLEAVVQDLRRTLRSGLPHRPRGLRGAALDICRQLKERNDTVALFLSDQRMPGMTGVDFLQQALTIYPERQARPADRLRRHRSRHPRHQLRQDPLLPQQALGPAGRKALPRARRSARSLEAGLQASV